MNHPYLHKEDGDVHVYRYVTIICSRSWNLESMCVYVHVEIKNGSLREEFSRMAKWLKLTWRG